MTNLDESANVGAGREAVLLANSPPSCDQRIAGYPISLAQIGRWGAG